MLDLFVSGVCCADRCCVMLLLVVLVFMFAVCLDVGYLFVLSLGVCYLYCNSVVGFLIVR